MGEAVKQEQSGGERRLWLERCAPLFFVSVASKGFSFPVNPLESTLMGIFVSVADKGVSGERLVASGELISAALSDRVRADPSSRCVRSPSGTGQA